MSPTGRLLAVVVVLAAVAAPGAAAAQDSEDRQTYTDAISWYAKQARSGDPKAQFYYGLALEAGVQGEADRKRAVAMFTRSAEAGFGLAQYKLGLIRQFGQDGQPVDLPAAREWYAKAAAQGVPEALYNLGAMLEAGTGGPRDAVAAAEHYRKAAYNGLDEAFAALGALYGLGDGLPQDLVESAKWLTLALRAGQTHVQPLYDSLAAVLTPDQRREAAARADAWRRPPH